MLNMLLNYAKKPDLYSPSTSNFWDDEHISKGMLEAHLNPSWDAASRNHEFIDKSVSWISTIAPPSQYMQLLDLGCGPGLYAERLNKAGYSVEGMDFSKRSIEYARQQAIINRNEIEYHYRNYLDIDFTEKYDVVTLIYCDYAVLPFSDRQMLIKRINQSLKCGGKFIFDVFTHNRRESERQVWNYFVSGGFFSAEPHIHLDAIYQYDDDDKTELNQNIIITKEEIHCYNIWNHYFNKEQLELEICGAGFTEYELYGDVSGSDYSEDGEALCVVAIK